MSGGTNMGRSFSEFFAYEDFRKLLDLDIAQSAGADAEYKAYGAHMDATYEVAFVEFLKALKADGVLHPIPGSGGRAGNFMLAWNAMATDDPKFTRDPDTDWYRIAQRFSHPFINLPLMLASMEIKKGSDAEEIAKAAYDKLIAAISEGRLPLMNGQEADYCHITGDRLYIQLDGWTPRLFQRGDDRKFVEITDIQRPASVAVEVEFKSGDLLIADWFRIPEVTAARKGISAFDINSEAGIEQATEWLLREKGILSVSVGNTSPRVIPQDGALVFGWIDEDAELSVKDIGSVCTDLWWVTVVERERLIEIVAESRGREEAEQVVAEYLRKHEDDIVRAQVEPGVHHLYFSGDYHGFRDAFRSPDLEIAHGIQPFFVLSDRPLRLEADAEMEQSLPRP